jgi:predicted nucleotidyltransferase
LLVSFSVPKSLPDIIGVQRKLKEFLGQDVDLVTEGGLKPQVRERIMRDLADVYGSR